MIDKIIDGIFKIIPAFLDFMNKECMSFLCKVFKAVLIIIISDSYIAWRLHNMTEEESEILASAIQHQQWNETISAFIGIIF